MTIPSYDLVWKETADLFMEMSHEEGWSTKAVMELPDITRYTSKVSAYRSFSPSLNVRQFALTIMARCGFGHESPWKTGISTADALSYGDALQLVTESCIERLILPRWAYSLPIAR